MKNSFWLLGLCDDVGARMFRSVFFPGIIALVCGMCFSAHAMSVGGEGYWVPNASGGYVFYRNCLSGSLPEQVLKAFRNPCQDSTSIKEPLTPENLQDAFLKYSSLAQPGRHRAIVLNTGSLWQYIYFDMDTPEQAINEATEVCFVQSFPDTMTFGQMDQYRSHINEYCHLLAVDSQIIDPEIAEIIGNSTSEAESAQMQLGLALGQILTGAIIGRVFHTPISGAFRGRSSGSAAVQGKSVFRPRMTQRVSNVPPRPPQSGAPVARTTAGTSSPHRSPSTTPGGVKPSIGCVNFLQLISPGGASYYAPRYQQDLQTYHRYCG